MIVYWPSKLILISYSHTAPTFAIGVEEFFLLIRVELIDFQIESSSNAIELIFNLVDFIF